MPVLTDEDVGLGTQDLSDADVGLGAPEPTETEKAAASMADTKALVESSRVARGAVPTIGPDSFTDRLKRRIFSAPVPQTSAELITGKPGVNAGVGDIAGTFLKFATPPPQIAEPIRNVTDPMIAAIPSPVGRGIVKGAREMALGFPVIPGANAEQIAKAVLTMFTEEQIRNLPERARAFVEASRRGDKQQMAELGTQEVLTDLGLGLAHAHERGLIPLSEKTLDRMAGVPTPEQSKIDAIARQGMTPSPFNTEQKAAALEPPAEIKQEADHYYESLLEIQKQEESTSSAKTSPEPTVKESLSVPAAETLPGETKGEVAEGKGPGIVGMGADVLGEGKPSNQTATGIKNAAVDAERQSRGKPPMLAPERLKNSVVWDRVMARIDNDPGWQDRLIDDLKEGRQTQVDADEVLALDHRYVDLQNEYAKATRDGQQAYSDGRMEDVALAKERAAHFESKLNELEQVAKRVGTEWGRSGQMRQRLMKEDFTLEAMEARRRAAQGFEPLSDEQHAEITAEFEAMKKKLEVAEQVESASKERLAKAEMDKALAEARAMAAQGPSYSPGVLSYAERLVKTWEKAAEPAAQRLRDRMKRTSLPLGDLGIISDAAIVGSVKIARGLVEIGKWTDAMVADFGEWIREYAPSAFEASKKLHDEKISGVEKVQGKVFADKVKKAITDTVDDKKAIKGALAEAVNDGMDDPDIGRYARKLAENYIEEQVKGGRSAGSISGKEITAAVHADLKDILPEMTDVEARDAWTQYGKYKAATTDPIRKRLIQASEEERKLSTLERLQKGEPGLKTGQQRVEATDLSRRRTKEINELNKKLGIRTTNPATQLKSTLDAIHTRNKNRIADLRYENATRKRIVRNKAATPSDAESIAQRAEIDRLKKENDAIFGDKTLTQEQRLARAIAAAERNAETANAALERAKKGDYSTPSGPSLPSSAKLESLKAEAKAAREQIAHLKDLDTAFQDAKRAKAQTSQIAEVDKRIEEVTRQINEGDIAAKKSPGKPVLPELAAKRGELADLNRIKAQLQNAAKPKKSAEEIATQARRTALASEIAFLKDRLAKGDFSPRRVAKDVPLDPAVARARAEVTLLREKFNRGTERLKYAQKSKAERAWLGTKEALNLSRAIMTSWDVSAVLRQGAIISFGNPARAIRAMKPMFEALFSEKKAAAVNEQIMARPNALNGNYAKSKLYLAPRENAHLSAMEEAYMSRLVHKIPGVHASERAYITFLNRLRADTFDALQESLADKGKGSQAELEAIANYVNVATGRGNLGKLAGAGEALSTAFFAPRLVASRFQMLAGQPLYHGSAATRFLVAKEYAKFLGGLAVVYGIGKLAGATIEEDPRSADFGKMKFGNTRLDPLAGLGQVTVLLSRIGSGKIKTAHGGLQPIRGDHVPYGHATAADLMGRFLRTKLSPIVGTGVDVATGKNVVGEKVTPGSVAMNTLTPLSFQDIYSVMKEQGIAEGTIIGILSAFGMSVQNYHTK